jgi:8-oxo-dGTP diphosphatase
MAKLPSKNNRREGPGPVATPGWVLDAWSGAVAQVRHLPPSLTPLCDPVTWLMLTHHRNPAPTVDAIIEVPDGIVLVKRRYPPAGWALPGGFVEYGERVEAAAVREAQEETGLTVSLTELFNVYSDPLRDPRQHTIGIVFIGTAAGVPVAGDDAAEARVFTAQSLPAQLAFDHRQILQDYFTYKRTGRQPRPRP